MVIARVTTRSYNAFSISRLRVPGVLGFLADVLGRADLRYTPRFARAGSVSTWGFLQSLSSAVDSGRIASRSSGASHRGPRLRPLAAIILHTRRSIRPKKRVSASGVVHCYRCFAAVFVSILAFVAELLRTFRSSRRDRGLRSVQPETRNSSCWMMSVVRLTLKSSLMPAALHGSVARSCSALVSSR